MFDRRFRKTIRMGKMIRRNEKVAVGLSGGKDSTVLLHSLAALREDLPMEIIAITIDEGIAGYRPKTMIPAQMECRRLGIEQKVVSFKDACGKTLDDFVGNAKDASGTLPCSRCGVLRRYALNKAARECGATKLAIGHNLDDMAQTVLMNIMRAEPSRLARMNEPLVRDARFVPRIRPLMMSPEKEVAIYAMMKGLPIERIECPYAKTAFRSHVRRILNESEERYPGTKFKIMKGFMEMEPMIRKGCPETKLAPCRTCGEPSSGNVCMYCRMIK